MKVKFFLAGLMFLSVSMTGAAAQPLPQNLKTVGEAHLNLLWFDFYRARLENPQGKFESIDASQMLVLTYYRSFSKQQLLKETRKQWRRAGIAEQHASLWLDQLSRFWPDVKKKDSLAFYRDFEGGGHFYFNQRHIGSLANQEFSHAFLAIWLSENSAFPALTRALKGY